jgi:oleandomycin transport system ATP-binding protein
MTNSIQAEGLTKRFGTVTAVDGIDLRVKEGTVFGLLGPNGAGKTTTVHILSTLTTPDEGHATIAGYDVKTQAHEVRQLIGLAGQYASVDEMLTGTENLTSTARPAPSRTSTGPSMATLTPLILPAFARSQSVQRSAVSR